MKASEARQLMNYKPQCNMTELYQWIAERAKAKHGNTWLCDERLTDDQLKELLSNGYEIQIKDSNYKIIWSNETAATN